jgi:HAD superfamily hydrolase (TIGR01484 family)
MQPLAKADLSHVTTVFTDVDGTLTVDGRLTSATVRSLESLTASGVDVVLVSGRSSGWGECWARQLPVAGVIVENGGLHYAHRKGALRKVYAQADKARRPARAKLESAVAATLKAVKGAKLSSDSFSREVDLAIDYAEDAALGPKGADAIEQQLRPRGVCAVRSSVHVNCWVGDFDKASAVKRFLSLERATAPAPRDWRFVFVGDSFNDSPLFAAFELSVGVANVRDVLERLDAHPKLVTRAREGAGFAEVAQAVLKARKNGGPA